jgi:hypothetical protein
MKTLITATIAVAVTTACSTTTEPGADPQLEALRASGEYNSCMPTVLRNGERGYRCEPKTGRGEVLIKKDRGYES